MIAKGDRLGLWTVIGSTATGKPRAWLVRCDCGTERMVVANSLRRGASTNCGCVRRAKVGSLRNSMTHGMYDTPTYRSWRSMVQRCTLTTCNSYPNYGARGVTVCERWLKFEHFLADMGERPEGTTLDRYPKATGNYEPGNCRWATIEQQNRNKGNVVQLTFRGETKSRAEWSREVGIGETTIAARMQLGWSVERALTTPPNPKHQPRHARAGSTSHG